MLPTARRLDNGVALEIRIGSIGLIEY
jgi:hypothetical protein